MSKLDELRAEQQRIQTQIRQLENRNKILLNRDVFPPARLYARARFSSMVICGAVPLSGSWKRRPICRLR